MKPIPDALLSRPFTVGQARTLNVSSRMLSGQRFVRVHPRVYRHRDHVMSEADHVEAARLALPDTARLTGISRIQQLGLDFGPRRPLRFVVEGKLHLQLDGIFLHRTKRLPPTADGGVSGAAAFVAYCRRARVIDAIKVGDWLLHEGHMTTEELRALALAEKWRAGADESLWILDHLRGDARSIKESEVRALLTFAGLPEPEVNAPIPLAEDVKLIADLLYRPWRTIVEYEGAHHQDDRRQYVSDLDRYAVLRRNGVHYDQVTRESIGRPAGAVRLVHRELVRAGYDGPSPVFAHPRWNSLFVRVHDLLAQDRQIARMSGGKRTVS